MSVGYIRAFVGPNSAGKSLACMAEGVVPSLAQGRPVVSNALVRPGVLGFPERLYVPLTETRQFGEIEHCTLWLDEITSVFPSRQYASMPVQLQRFLNQMRKADVDVLWTAPHWSRADVILREVTQSVTVCRGYLPDRWQRDPDGVVRDVRGRKVRVKARWPYYRLFRWTTFDALEYDEYQEKRRHEIKPRRVRWYWRPWHRDCWAYSTLQPVGLLDHLDATGVCMSCGGNRRRPSCSCPPVGGAGGSPEGSRPAPEPAPLPADVPYFVRLGG